MSLLNVLIAKKLGGSGGSGTDANAVHYTADTGKSDSEKAQARTNIGVLTAAEIKQYLFETGIYDLLPVPTAAMWGMALVANDDNTADWKVVRPLPVTVSGATPTITPVDNRCYKCGELTSLTITDPPATGSYSIVFTSGATPTTTTFPASILGLENFSAAANTRYEINVMDGAAVVGSWDVSS